MMNAKKYSRQKIQDKFTGGLTQKGTPMSRQQLYILRRRAEHLCITCGAPAETKNHCRFHAQLSSKSAFDWHRRHKERSGQKAA